MRILYIDIDCTRPDHLGCYGYHRQTSPTIDQIAREGIVFERYYPPDAPCLPSRTAFYSGRFGIQTGVVGHGGTAAQPKIQGPNRGFRDFFDTQGLAGCLQSAGYHTAMISPFGQRHAAWHFYAGFNEIHNTGSGGMESAEVVQPIVDKWIADNAARDNWMLHINYWDPHTPYRAPKEFGDPFAKDPLPAWLDNDETIRRHNQAVGPHTSLEVGMYDANEDPQFPRHPGKVTNREELRRMIDGYDTGIRFVDEQIGRVVAALKAAGVYDDTAIIISSDHGENLGELGLYGEHGTADEITCHVPMVVKFPGGKKGIREKGFHYNLDWAPTLMDLIGGKKQPLWDGISFAPAILEGKETGREDLVISQCAHVCQRSVRWDKWLYMRTYHDGFHLFPREMLFDLEADPHEEHNLAAKLPQLCQEGAWRLNRWHDAQMEKMARISNDVVDPLWTVMKESGPFHANLGDIAGTPGREGFERYLKHLEKTGRGDGARELRAKYAHLTQPPEKMPARPLR
jgi:arylsulfatase A-like enzyme